MKTTGSKLVALIALILFNWINVPAQGTAFTYQGRLTGGGTPATGNYDLRFALFNASSAGNQVGSTVTNAPVAVSKGLFTVTLDFGANAFTGAPRWLEIGVRTNDGGVFRILPRQLVTSEPYSLFAARAGAVDWANVSDKPTLGTVTSVSTGTGLTGGPITSFGTISVDTTVVPQLDVANTFTAGPQTVLSGGSLNKGVVIRGTAGQTANLQEWQDSSGSAFASITAAGVVTGNGAGLTNISGASLVNLNADNISSGTLADARLSANVPLLNRNQTFTGSNSFSGISSLNNAANNFAGSFTGNGAGLTNLNGANLVNLNAANISSGTLADARLSANVPLLNRNQTFAGSNSFSGVSSLTNSANNFVGSFSGNGAGLTNISGASLVNLNADNISSGTLADARLSANVPLLNRNQTFTGTNTFSGVSSLINGANNFAGSFIGNGAGLTNLNGANLVNLNAGNISSGTLADARLSANVPLLNRNQTFTGANTFNGVSSLNNAANNFAGSFTGNGAGLTNLNGANLVNLNAGNISSGTLADARLSANVPLLNRNQTFTGSNSFSGVSSLTNSANNFVGSFSGNGAGLSNIVSTATNFSGSLAGDVTGPINATTVARIRGVNVSAVAPTANQHLRFDGASWTPAAVALASDVSGTLAVANGGSGATTASGARANLGAAASGANSDITSLSGLTIPLAAAQGGSGQSSYTAGDLLYASTSTSLSKLSDVAAGSSLLSGGVGTPPVWGKIGLTTHVTGTLPIANGGSGAATASSARANFGAAASGANSDITSLAGLTTPLSAAQGGSGQSSYTIGDLLYASASTGLSKLSDVATGNSLLSGGAGAAPVWGKIGLTTHVTGTLPIANGGSGAATASAARANFGAAASGANADITSLTGLTTPLSATQGGSGQSSYTTGDILYAPTANTLARRTAGTAGQVLTVSAGVPVWTNANAHNHHGQSWVGTNFDGLAVQSTATNGTGLHGLANVGDTAYGVFGESFEGFGVVGSGGDYGVYGYSATGFGIFAQSGGGPFFPQLVVFQDNPNDLCRLRMGCNGWPQWNIAITPGALPNMNFFNGTTNVMVVDFVGNVTATSFNPTSDRNAKENFGELDAREILAQVARLPIQTWNFKDDHNTRHIGPMAQDFHAAFQVGPDDKHIATVDADGVALAAIQGLNQVVKEKDARIEALEKRLGELEKIVTSLAKK